MRTASCVLVVTVLLASAAPAEEASHWGRDLEHRNKVSLGLSFGSLMSMKGSVQETIRPIYQITGRSSTEGAENMDLEDLGFTDSYPMFGMNLEVMWTYFTLQLHGAYFNPSADGIADRDFYMGVSDVTYAGQEYDYMLIRKGEPYSADLEGGRAGARVHFTPITLEAAALPLEFVPSLYAGISAFFAHYEIDAGPAEGTILYENPPHEYVVGGVGKGWTGMAVPEIGVGSELILWQSTRHEREFTLTLKGYYSIFQFEGTTEDLGVSSRHDKLLDLDYESYEIWLVFDVPVSKTVDVFFGGGYQFLEANADVEAKDRPVEEVLTLREKFDKKINVEAAILTAVAGLRF